MKAIVTSFIFANSQVAGLYPIEQSVARKRLISSKSLKNMEGKYWAIYSTSTALEKQVLEVLAPVIRHMNTNGWCIDKSQQLKQCIVGVSKIREVPLGEARHRWGDLILNETNYVYEFIDPRPLVSPFQPVLQTGVVRRFTLTSGDTKKVMDQIGL